MEDIRTGNGAPGKTQRSGFVGERTSTEMSEFSAKAGNEGYAGCEDEHGRYSYW